MGRPESRGLLEEIDGSKPAVEADYWDDNRADNITRLQIQMLCLQVDSLSPSCEQMFALHPLNISKYQPTQTRQSPFLRPPPSCSAAQGIQSHPPRQVPSSNDSLLPHHSSLRDSHNQRLITSHFSFTSTSPHPKHIPICTIRILVYQFLHTSLLIHCRGLPGHPGPRCPVETFNIVITGVNRDYKDCYNLENVR